MTRRLRLKEVADPEQTRATIDRLKTHVKPARAA